MNDEFYKTNMIKVYGVIVGPLDYSHSVGVEKFLKGNIRVMRASGQTDTLPFVVSERLVPDWALGDGDEVTFVGQLRSHNVQLKTSDKSKLEVVIFVRDFIFNPESEEFQSCKTNNLVMLTGRICKPPIYRVTHFGREICNIMLAVNRAFGKSDYIPCIAWGGNAQYIGNQMKVGDLVRINGRYQSRDYSKVLPGGKNETRTAYEVSVFELFV